MIIADANVITYLVVPGPFSSGAAELLDADPQWSAPPIWQDEVLNALTKYVRDKKITVDEAVDGFSAVLAVVRTNPPDLAARELIQLALDSGCGVYDCEYVRAAQHIGVKLVTEDKQVLRRFPDVAVSINEFLQSGKERVEEE